MSDPDRILELLTRPEPRVTWLFAGDSITHGALHTFGHRDYVEHFAERLRYELRRVMDTVIKTASNGWRMTNLQAELEWAVLRHAPTVVSINLGMNDCASGIEKLDAFRSMYLDVIRTIRAQTKALLILHTPNAIDTAGGGMGRAESIGRYVDVIREIARETGALLVDHYADWEAARARGGAMIYWLSDPIHPNEYGHRAMAHTLLRALGLFDEKSHVCRLLVP